MKKIILICISIFLLGSANCQNSLPGVDQHHYLKKSKNLKTTGWIFFASGLTIAAVGGLIQLHDWKEWQEFDDTGGWDIVPDFRGFYTVMAGGCVALISTPFFIVSGVNKRKAASFSLNQQKIPYLQEDGLRQKWAPAFTLAIKL